MSQDWLVSSLRPIELAELVAGLSGPLPELSVRASDTGRWTVLVDDADVPLVWISVPQPVQAQHADAVWLRLPSSFAASISGRSADAGSGDERQSVDAPAGQAWWTEVCGASETLVARVAEGLAAAVDGTAVRWSSLADDAPGVDPSYGDCPVDLVTNGQALQLCSRPVASLSLWLVEGASWASEHDREFVLLTHADTCLTRAAAHWLLGIEGLWAVDPGTGDGLYEGFTGARLVPESDGLVAKSEIHPAYSRASGAASGVDSPDSRWALAVDAECLHAYDAEVPVGALATAVVSSATALTVEPVQLDRYGAVEPLGLPLDLDEVGSLAAQSDSPLSRFHLAATTNRLDRGAELTLTLIPGPAGVLEHAAGLVSADELLESPSRCVDFARELLDAGAGSVVAGARETAPGRVVPPRHTAPLRPLVVVAHLDRYRGLRIEEALALGGPESTYDEERRAVIVVAAPQDPIGHHVRLLTLLAAHDTLKD